MGTETPAGDLPWTGERYVPQIGGEIELEHVHRYLWAAQFARGKRVLDIACGEGYGSEILARAAAHVIGVDLSEDAVVHASRKYFRKNLEFLVGSCDRIPVPDGSIDSVVSFETIEHHDRHHEMMQEIKRILRPEGILIISSPDKYVYSDIPGYKNEFHVRELYAREFEALVKGHFANVHLFGQGVSYGSVIAGEGAGGFLSFDSEQKSPPATSGIARAIYNVAIASDSPVPEAFSSIYEQNVTKSARYRALQMEIEARGSKLDELREELRRQKTALQHQSMQSAESIRELRAEIEHLKITRFEAKRECHSMKTSLSWRLTRPLRVLRDTGAAFVYRSQRRLSSAIGSRNAHSATDRLPSIDVGLGHHEHDTRVAQQLIEHQLAGGLSNIDRNKETVLLVSHEISRTGAPILVLNLASAFRQKYNVIVLTLGDGALRSEFLAVSNLMVGPLTAERRSPRFLTALFREIVARAPLKFAIVNSIVSGVTLSALWENDIAIVHLIHEFSAYTLPRGQFRSSAFFSGERIFPAEIVRDAASEETPDPTAKRGRVLPQGICVAPPSRLSAEARANEREKIRSDLRPAGWPKDTVVILGAGFVHLRKGVDLFVACAKRVSEMMPKRRFRFVWIGDGFDPQHDATYSVYLEDQVKRSNLGETLAILKAVDDIESVYLESDILFLSSRLDPLPLVSMDALFHRRPVVCFESTTGIAEYLARDSIASFGIVPLLDVEEAARRIFRLIEDSDFRTQVGAASRELAKSRFSLEHYVEELDAIARGCALKKEQEKVDRLVISKSNLFDNSFFKCPLSPENQHDPIRSYISAYSSGIRPRKALPGFHPGIYAEHNDTDGRDPLAHYLDSGRPQGPWTFDVIHETPQIFRIEQSVRVGLHLHLYYREMAEEIFDHLCNIHSRIDLLVSVTSPEASESAKGLFSGYSSGEVEIRIFNNRGRDIGPFLTGFGETILNRYDVIGHIHTKKSADTGENGKSMARAWTHFLYTNLLGGARSMADAIVQRFALDNTIGLVFPDDPHIVGWEKNLPYALNLAERLGIAELLAQTSFNFPVGTMFWARTSALRPLLELGLTWDDYPAEPLPYDGSLLHAIERILPFVAQKTGFRSVVTYVTGITR